MSITSQVAHDTLDIVATNIIFPQCLLITCGFPHAGLALPLWVLDLHRAWPLMKFDVFSALVGGMDVVVSESNFKCPENLQ